MHLNFYWKSYFIVYNYHHFLGLDQSQWSCSSRPLCESYTWKYLIFYMDYTYYNSSIREHTKVVHLLSHQWLDKSVLRPNLSAHLGLFGQFHQFMVSHWWFPLSFHTLRHYKDQNLPYLEEFVRNQGPYSLANSNLIQSNNVIVQQDVQYFKDQSQLVCSLLLIRVGSYRRQSSIISWKCFQAWSSCNLPCPASLHYAYI